MAVFLMPLGLGADADLWRDRLGSGVRLEIGCPPDLADLVWTPGAPVAGYARASWWGAADRAPSGTEARPVSEIPLPGLLLPGDGDYDRPAPPPPDPAEAWRAGLPDLIAQIDGETQRRALSGYEWPAGSGVRYSTSLAAQTSTLGLGKRIERGRQTWPQSISRLDGSVGELRDEAEGQSFVDAGLDAVASRLDYGRALKVAALGAADPDAWERARGWVAAYTAGETPNLESP